MRQQNIERFFAYARERQKIMHYRRQGFEKPWTKDKVLQNFRFCCVHREDDKTTQWFRTHVRDPLRDRPEVLLATVVFRMFNRIETGEAIFCDDDLLDESSAFYSFLRSGNTYDMKRAIVARQGSGPYVTGAYIISSPPGKSKLDGVLWVLRNFYEKSEWRNVAHSMQREGHSLESAWRWLKSMSYLGPFHSYEIVTDLRHTNLLCDAPDIMTWCAPGPGARRGLRRIQASLRASVAREDMLPMMAELLRLAGQRRMWPWPEAPWDMRTVEHTLCEFDKHERMTRGEGKMKGKFDGK